MIFYDGMHKSYDFDELESMMKQAYVDLCDMSMGNRDCEYSMICTNDALKRHGGNPFQLEVEGDGKGWKQVRMQPNEGMPLSQRGPTYGGAYGNGRDYESEAIRLSQRREPLHGFEDDDDDAGPGINGQGSASSAMVLGLGAAQMQHKKAEREESSSPWTFVTGAASGAAGILLAGIFMLVCLRRYKRVSRIVVAPRCNVAKKPRNSLINSLPDSLPSTPRSLNGSNHGRLTWLGSFSNAALVQLGGRSAGEPAPPPSPLTLPPQLCKGSEGDLASPASTRYFQSH